MKKLTKKLLLVVLSTFMLFGLTIGVGCDCGDTGSQGNGPSFPSTPVVAEVSLSTTNAKLIVGDSLTITAYTNKVPGLSVEFSSENDKIATIDEFGLIEAHNKGTTNIVAKYGETVVKCAITVDFDDSIPEIVDLSASNKDYVLYKGDSFTFKPAIKYRGKVYDDGEFTFISTNEDVVYFDGNTLIAKDQISVANCYVEASWRGFDSEEAGSLRRDFSVKVMTEAYISLEGTSEDFIELYTHNEFEGQTFTNSSEFVPVFYADGEQIENVEFNYDIENGSILDFNNGVITAKSYGEATVNLSCEHEGVEYLKSINVNIIRPVADYEMELNYFSTGLGTFKDASDNYVEKTIANKIYGNDDVTIIEAFQGKKILNIEDNKIFGIKGASNEAYHTVITIGTNTEVYNVGLVVYGLYIKTAEDLGYFSTQAELPDYYYLANDVDAYGFVMPKYGESPYGNERNGLTGTFEGNGYVIKGLTVNTRGMFGGITAGTVQNVGFYDTVLTGYYPCLIAHWETGASTLKNMYVHFKDIPPKAGGLYQQRFHLSATHENIVVEYGISKEDVIARVEKYKDNSENISTFAPQRGQVWTDNLLKNCFSISYAPIGLSQPSGTDYSWSSFVVAQNQVTETENAETGRIDLTFTKGHEWLGEEIIPRSTFKAIKKVNALEGAIQVAKGIKAYNTKEDMQADADANAKILETYDLNYWVIDNGVPYWKQIYQNNVMLTVTNNKGEVVEDYTLSKLDEYLEVSLDVYTSKLNVEITAPEGLRVEGNKIYLAKALTEPAPYEVTLSTYVAGKAYSKVITILATPEQILSNEEVLYEFDTKSLDFDAVNEIYDLTGDMAISSGNLDGFFVGTSSESQNGDIELPVVIKADKSDVEAVTLKLLANGKMYVLTNVKAYTKFIDEASDLDYFAHNFKETGVATENSGYYVVTKDIDATGYVAKNHEYSSGKGYPSGDERALGLTGVFDGRGHVISNYVAPSNGIFGAAYHCVIKNVAFEDVSLTKQSNYAATYPGLFAHEISGTPNGDYTVISNVYVSVKENQGKNVFVGNSIHPTTKFENVVVEYNIYGEADENKLLNNGSISLAHNTQLPIANYSKIGAYKNSFVISKAPLNFVAKNDAITMIHVAENQVEIKTTTNEADEIVEETVTVIDNDIAKLVNKYGYTLTSANVATGVKAYDTIEELSADKQANAEILATYDSKYWIVVEGIPYWKNAYYNKVQPIVTDASGNEVSDFILDSTDKKLTVNLTNGTNVLDGATITAPEGIIVNGNEISLANAPTSKGSYEITISKEIEGYIVTRTITVQYTNEKLVEGKVLYSADDKALDFVSLNNALNAVGVEDIESIDSYIVNGEEVDVLDLEVIISNDTKVNQGRDRAVDTAQTVVINVGDKAYLLSNVYAYTKVLDEAEDLNYFVMSNQNEYNEVDGYFVLSKNIDATDFDINAHTFVGNAIYPGNGYNTDVGFRGVLDGLGYTIDGLTVKSCGLFASMNAPIVKNIAFTNANLTGYYKTLFAKKYSRGKDYNNEFNYYESIFQNVYVSINSIDNTSGDNNVGILTQETLPATVNIENVIVEYTNVTEDVQAKIDAGKNFYMFGSNGFGMQNAIAVYKNSYAITTAPVLSRASMSGFAENQVEYTIGKNDKGKDTITAVGNVLDPIVTKILGIHGKTLTIENVMVGLRAYANYEAMKADTANDYTSFDSAYWTIVDGVPCWTTAM